MPSALDLDISAETDSVPEPSTAAARPLDHASDPNTFGYLWHRAITKYEENTGINLLTYSLTRQLADLDSLEDTMRLFEPKMK